MSDREELMRLALVAGLQTAQDYEYRGGFKKMTVPEMEELLKLERFAELVAAKEREACAQMCDHLSRRTKEAQSGPADALANVMLRQVATLGHAECAAAIRARGAADGNVKA
ncbi:hypothetical protein [Paracidovorax citrulli]|uniref:hypothetical protein n=1 Tax=Paracidovorax citrulli TaxID=80869 RepID=UPI000A861B3E|nr:hypothetical protein [Paracidovorax citrulli]